MSTVTTGVVAAARLRLAASLASVPEARRFVVSLASDWDVDGVDVAELCVSELVSNAVRHARSAPVVDVVVDDDGFHIGVSDADRAVPVRRSPEPWVPGGRGVAIVEDCSARTWVEVSDSGKTVWCTLHRAGT